MSSARLVLAGLATVLIATTAHAGSVTAPLSPFTGDAASFTATFDDMTDPGNIVITLDVVVDPNTADLRGFFFDIADDALLGGLSVVGADITQQVFDANDVSNLGGGNNVNGGGSPCPCDIGLEIGTPGMSTDDLQTVTFTLQHTSVSLDLSLFAGQAMAGRVTSVGLPGGSRNGSSKLAGVIPEPSTGILVGLGIAGLARQQRRR